MAKTISNIVVCRGSCNTISVLKIIFSGFVFLLVSCSEVKEPGLFTYERTIRDSGVTAWHPNGKWLAVHHRKNINVWNVEANKKITILTQNLGVSLYENSQLIFSKDGQYLIALDEGKFSRKASLTVKKSRLVGYVWATADWSLVTKLMLPDANKFSVPKGLCLLADGRRAVIANRHYIAIFDIETGEQTYRNSMIFPFDDKSIEFDFFTMRCHPTQNKVALGGFKPLKIDGDYQSDPDVTFSTPSVPFLIFDPDKNTFDQHIAHTKRILLDYSGDGAYLITSPSRGGRSKLPKGWDKPYRPKDENMRWYIAQEPAYIWDTNDWQTRHNLELPRQFFHGLQTYNQLACMVPVPGTPLHIICDAPANKPRPGHIRKGPILRLWDLRTGRSHGQLPDRTSYTVSLSSDGKRIAVLVKSGIEIYRLRIPPELLRDSQHSRVESNAVKQFDKE